MSRSVHFYLHSLFLGLAFCGVFGLGSNQTYRTDSSGTIWTLDHGSLPIIAVHHLVSYEEAIASDGARTIDLKLNDSALASMRHRAVSLGIDVDSDPIHTISVIGSTSGCGKAFLLNSLGTASLDQPAVDEALVDFAFPFSCPDVPDAKRRLGIFVSDPVRRYGAWFVMMMVRYPPHGSKVVGSNRMRSLALQMSSGSIFMTLLNKFKWGSTDNAADALVLVTNDHHVDDHSDDTGSGSKRTSSATSSSSRTRSHTNAVTADFIKIPIVGLRTGKRGEESFSEQFFDQTGTTLFEDEQSEIKDILQRVYDPIEFEIYSLPTTTTKRAEFASLGPWPFVQKYAPSLDLELESEDPTDSMVALRAYRVFVEMGGVIMRHVARSQKQRVLSMDALLQLFQSTVHLLNSRDLNTKEVWLQVAGKTCQAMIQHMFEDGQFATKFDRGLMRITAVTRDSQNVRDSSNIQSFVDRENEKGKQVLAHKLPMVWSNVQEECTKVFDQQFAAIYNDALQRVSEQLRADVDEQRTRRLKAEAQLAEHQWMYWMLAHWKEILIAVVVVVVFVKVVACLKCGAKCCGWDTASLRLKRIEKAISSRDPTTMMTTVPNQIDEYQSDEETGGHQ